MLLLSIGLAAVLAIAALPFFLKVEAQESVTTNVVPITEDLAQAEMKRQLISVRGGEIRGIDLLRANAPDVANAIRTNAGCNTNTLPANDDGSTTAVTMPFSLNYFGVTYTQTFVNNNGNITFNGPLSAFTPFNLNTTNVPIIAPFFADVDTRGTGSGLTRYGTDTVNGRPAFCVNWINVGYFASRVDKLNSFQLVLIERNDTGAGNFDIEFNYNTILWETGDASNGTGGLGGNSARVGFANGTMAAGTFFELAGSAVNGAFLDSNIATGLTNNSRNSGLIGRYLFTARNGGIPTPTPTPTATPTPGCITQTLVDPSIEASVVGAATITNPNWPSTSANFDSTLCSGAFCGNSGGTANPRTGTFYSWFGGTANAETSSLQQTRVIPAGSNPTLKYWLRVGAVATPFNATLVVRVDGTVVQTITEPGTAEAAYTERVVSLPAAVANGASHVIRFEYTNPAGSGSSNFTVDDITLEVATTGVCPTPTPVATPTPTPVATPTPTPTPVPTPTPGCIGQNLVDPSIEASVVGAATITNPNWPSTSTNFDSSICSAAFCGNSGGTANPRTGTFYSWFGGTPNTEASSLQQTRVVPVGTNPTLRYWLRIGAVATPFNATLVVRVDGTVVQTITEPGTAEAAYTERVVSLPAGVANGASHVIRFEYTNPAGSGSSNFTVDDITLETTSPACSTPTPTPTPVATPTPTPTPSPTPTTFLAFSSPTYRDDESQSVTVTVVRTGVTTGTTTATVAPVFGGGKAVGGAACTSGVDYVNTPQVVTFAPGVLTQTVQIQLCGDSSADPNETFNLNLVNATAGTGVLGNAVVTINDTANQFKNTAPISIIGGSTAGLYPSPITVTGATTNVFRIRVTLYDYYHEVPDNLDVLLVGPNGARYVIHGDVGGPTAITEAGAVTLSYADYPNAVLPDNGPLVTGIFKPTTCETPVSTFAAPAPAGPYVEPGCVVARPNAQTLFGAFGGSNGNGVWNLYVRDDNGVARPLAPEVVRGQINGGWGIELLASTAAGVEVSGRVLTPDGRGLRNATVIITDSEGNRRTAVTSSFGFFRFYDVEVGSTLIMGVSSNRYRFTPRVVQVFDTLSDVDLIAQE